MRQVAIFLNTLQGTTSCWIFTFTVTQLFPIMKAGIGTSGVFYLFSGICVISVIWYVRLVLLGLDMSH
jgi:hypothetical protein